jgi:hypothetical protein
MKVRNISIIYNISHLLFLRKKQFILFFNWQQIKFFIETANPDQIREANDFVVLFIVFIT